MNRTRVIAMLAVVSLAGFTAACGDDDESANSTTTEQTQTTTEMSASKDIVATASETPDLSTLVTAVQAAGLVETLQGKGPYTVFAPTNEAFSALGEDTIKELTTTKTDDLKQVLLNHTVEGSVMAADLSDGQKVKTVGGKTLTVSIDGSTVKVGGATVAQPDVETSNGVVHIIDKVIQ